MEVSLRLAALTSSRPVRVKLLFVVGVAELSRRCHRHWSERAGCLAYGRARNAAEWYGFPQGPRPHGTNGKRELVLERRRSPRHASASLSPLPYRVPSVHIAWSTTASLRATATMARLRPFDRDSLAPKLRSAEGLPRPFMMTLAARNSAERTSTSPALEIRPGLSRSPDWYRRGVSPK